MSEILRHDHDGLGEHEHPELAPHQDSINRLLARFVNGEICSLRSDPEGHLIQAVLFLDYEHYLMGEALQRWQAEA